MKNFNEIEEIVQLFINLRLPKDAFTHEAHLLIGFWHCYHHTNYEAIYLLRTRIILFTQSVGAVNTLKSGYHETLTRFWVEIINQFLEERGREQDFTKLVNEFLESDWSKMDLPLKYYDKDTLFSAVARATFVKATPA